VLKTIEIKKVEKLKAEEFRKKQVEYERVKSSELLVREKD